MPALVDFRNVYCQLGGKDILRSINLAIEPGETLVVLGRSGSGKTTLLRLVNRMVEPTTGQIRFGGRELHEWDRTQLRRRMGYVIQEGGLFPHWSVERNVGLVPELERWPDIQRRERIAEVLEAVKLPPATFGSRRPRELSGGEKQRVGIARALAGKPDLLLLDEPFSALDPITRWELQQHFLELRKAMGTTAIFVTHDIREALTVASRIVLLRDGEAELVDSPQAFLRATTPEAQAFLATLGDNQNSDDFHARG